MNDAWEDYRSKVLPAESSPAAVQQHRDTFLAGWVNAYQTIQAIAGGGKGKASNFSTFLEELQSELTKVTSRN